MIPPIFPPSNDWSYALNARMATVYADCYVRGERSSFYDPNYTSLNSLEGLCALAKDMAKEEPFRTTYDSSSESTPHLSEEAKFVHRLPVWEIVCNTLREVMDKEERILVPRAGHHILLLCSEYGIHKAYQAKESELRSWVQKHIPRIQDIQVFNAEALLNNKGKTETILPIGEQLFPKENARVFNCLLASLAPRLDTYFHEKAERANQKS